MFQSVTATQKIMKMKKRIKVVAGGTSASKTISILLILIDLAQSDKKPTLTSVVSESIPHLKAGSIRDFKAIMTEHNYWNDDRWNSTDRIYTFETGSQIEFFSSDNGQKCHGPRRDRLFVNEANHVPWRAFEQMEIRTKGDIWIDYNPDREFWAHTELIGRRDDVEFLIVTYLDNEALDQTIIDSIERRKGNKRWWTVYGLGQLGSAEGIIYPDIRVISEIPQGAKKVRRGLDFGWNDPAAVVSIYRLDGRYILDQVAYGSHMTNETLASAIKNDGNEVMTYCDSAEPKSIDELVRLGVNAVGATKGAGSVLSGIKSIQDVQLDITSRSVDVIKDFRNYMWKIDKDEKILDEPDHEFSHAPDAVRYGFDGLLGESMDYKAKIKKHHVKITRYG